MRFDAERRGDDGSPLLIAFAVDDPGQGDSYFFDWFSYRESLPPGDYTLTNGEKRIVVTLPEEATRQAFPGHLLGQSVEKGATHA